MSADTIVGYELRDLPIEVVEYDAFQPRKDLSAKTSLVSLKRSVERYGIQQPIAVTEYEPGKFKIIDGHRRYICATEIGMHAVPCLIYPALSDGDMEARRYEMQNIRRPWKPLERSDALTRMKKEFGFTSTRELAEYIGISETAASDYIFLREQQLHLLDRISGLPDSYQVELSRLKPHMRKHAGLEVDQIIDILIERIHAGVIKNSKDIRVVKSAFIRIDLYGDMLTTYLQDTEMRVKDLSEQILRTGFSRDIQGIVAAIARKKSRNEALTDKEKGALEQLMDIAREVL